MSTYTPIASVTLSSAQSSVTFSGIPQTYTDLVVVGFMRSDTTTFNNMNFPQVQFNGDTGSTYSNTTLYSRNTGGGWSALSARSSNTDGINSGGIATTSFGSSIFSTYIVNVMNYTNTTTNKTVIARVGTGGDLTNMDGTSANVGLWRNTAAITSLRIVASSSGNFVAGSTFNLYGVANASITNVAKATGGDTVVTDGTYWYHVFRSSGTFTPTQALTADCLVVAGGGAGGNAGGGAGGVLSQTSQSLSATAYTVTVGAGGAGASYPGPGSAGSNSQFGSLTASVGGGYGGDQSSGTGSGGNGGSGGGEGFGRGTNAVGTGTSGQGFAGGLGYSDLTTYTAGGGGGGAGAAGTAVSSGNGNGGNGGIGATSTFINAVAGATNTGQLVSGNYYFAGGGGGATVPSKTQGTGGSGGGAAGLGRTTAGNGNAATGNTGGGGGGQNYGATGGIGGAGGSGIVIVRYAA